MKLREKSKRKIIILLIAVMVLFSICFKSDTLYAASYTIAHEYDGLSADTKANCVAFARYKVPSLPGGLWTLEDKKNIINCKVAKAGVIAITKGSTSAGHVAYVETVNGNQITTLNGGYDTGTYIERITGTESEQGILGYWYPANVQVVNNPVGCIDAIEGRENAVCVSGWAYDADNVSQALEIHVYIGGPAGVGEGHRISANQYRSDVNSVYGVGNYHGFDAEIPISMSGDQEVYIYAINIGDGENLFMGAKSVTIVKSNDPIGCIDAIEGRENAVFVNGWVFDLDDVSQALEMHVYIGGPAGVGETYVISANQCRDDVNDIYGVGNYHGFEAEIPTSMKGDQEVYIYAINIGSGENLFMGAKTVTITDKVEENKHTHSYQSQVTKQPGCTTAGVKTFTCSGCGDSYTETIAATGHKYTKATQNPTCTAKGSITYTCTVCSHSYKEEIAALGHKYTKTTQNSTCTEKGAIICTCSVCKHKYTEKTLPAAGHKYVTTTTVAVMGKNGAVTTTCKVCKKKSQTIIYAPRIVTLVRQQGIYNGRQQTSNVIVRDSQGKALRIGKDYTVSYQKDMKSVGSHDVMVRFKGNYRGAVKLAYIINPKGTSISKASSRKKGFDLKWKKQAKEISGYEVVYSTSNKFTPKSTKILTVGKGKTSKSITGLKAKKKYYVRMRTYKTVKGKKYYSDWSKAKSVRTKRVK